MSEDRTEAVLPEVVLDAEYPLKDGRLYRIYRVGDWSMEWVSPAESEDMDSDASVEKAEEAVQAWTAWRNFLESDPWPTEAGMYLGTDSTAHALVDNMFLLRGDGKMVSVDGDFLTEKGWKVFQPWTKIS